MNTDNGRPDDVLGRRLSAALGAEAARAEVPSDAWARFEERALVQPSGLTEPWVDGAKIADKPETAGVATVSMTTSPERGGHPWRVPLIAAAAVVAIALATAAIATGGFGATHRAAAPGSDTPSAEVRVPVDWSYETYVVAGGAGGNAPASSSVESTTTESWPAAKTSAVLMSFEGGDPPRAILSGRFAAGGQISRAEDAQKQRSDGTALGYVAHFSAIAGDAPGATPVSSTTVWGAVGPDVAQIQVIAPISPVAAGLDPGFSGAQAHWTIDSGRGTAFSSPGSETSTWTTLFDGWNGFAVELPVDANTVTIIALGANGQELQNRAIVLDTGQVTDAPVATPTGLPPASATATLSPIATTVTASPPATATTVTGTGLGNAPSSLAAPEGGSGRPAIAITGTQGPPATTPARAPATATATRAPAAALTGTQAPAARTTGAQGPAAATATEPPAAATTG